MRSTSNQRMATLSARQVVPYFLACASTLMFDPLQFLDTASNLRTDAYGGSVANRVRFAQEVLDAILSVWPSDRVGIKLSPFGGYNDVGMDEQATIVRLSLSFSLSL